MSDKNQQLANDTYDIIRGRLQKQKQDLQDRIAKLNTARQDVFGALDTKLIAKDRILTENSCISHDIVSFNDVCIFGYNVNFGLRTEIQLSDVFSIYKFSNKKFEPQDLEFINDPQFQTDFTNLYKYYRDTFFTRFARIGNFLHMVFQISENPEDVKTFKWAVLDDKLEYVDNRSDHEYRFPPQHDFNWQEATRDMQRYGKHPHVSILDKVFVEAVGGDLTIKVEDNTSDGEGIYSEDVEYLDQTLDDGKVRFGEFGNLISIEITPFQENPRYFVYNHKVKQVKKIESLSESAVFLPDEQGLIFPTGYYLQTGEYHLFDNIIKDIKYVKQIASPNGEDYLYVFYSPTKGLYNLMHYNVIQQEVSTPIICNGFTIFEDGELCYFKHESEQSKHHVVQIWQTPFSREVITPTEHQDSMLFKIGNKDIVKAMAETNALITLLNKEDNYGNLYVDMAKSAKDILDRYYWLNEPDTFRLDEPINGIKETAHTAIDEFERVVELKQSANKNGEEIRQKAEKVFAKIKSTSLDDIDEFVNLLSQLRTIRGEVISLKEIPYIDVELLDNIEEEVAENQDRISERCVQFLLDDKALQPYQDRVEAKKSALEETKKVIEITTLEEEVNTIGNELELLIEIVSNLKIEDTSHTTKIIDNISLIYTQINQLKAAAKNKKQNLGSEEAKAEFAAQIKLIDQSVFNYFDLADAPEKCDEYQNKVTLQLEDLEAKFIDFEDFVLEITEKREEIFASFDSRKSTLIEKKNQRANSIQTSSKRVIESIRNKLKTFESVQDINAYLATDLMVNKIRNNIDELRNLDNQGGAESLETALTVAREDAIRQLKDRQDLYEDGDSVIKLGKHKFGVNQQALDLTIVLRDEQLYYHLTGTDFYQPLNNDLLLNNRQFWSQDYVSENKEVYRSEYLAYKIFNKIEDYANITHEQIEELVKNEANINYAEGYTKGVHDLDAIEILTVLIQKHEALGMLTYPSHLRAQAQFFWNLLDKSKREHFLRLIHITGEVVQSFSKHARKTHIISKLTEAYQQFAEENDGFESNLAEKVATYLIDELQSDDEFAVSIEAYHLHQDFDKYLHDKKVDKRYQLSIDDASNMQEKILISRQWIESFIYQHNPELLAYLDEVVCLSLFADVFAEPNTNLASDQEITDLRGSHSVIKKGVYHFEYHGFTQKLSYYYNEVAKAFLKYRETRHEVIEELKSGLKLSEFEPKVLSSFVRNKLIDQVYFPLFGDNLAKQMGTVGENKRVDRMGMLLLISPPGYGKTTLMEYVANRLGLIFVKINGPAIGHEVTSVDPESAPNSAAREELKRLNMAFEMGNNVMLYLDDIQHCNPEFLQKFISLSDGTRKIEGVFNGKSQTYDLRDKKFCIIMAGNPYTESGDKFRIPDMLANRADIYNLGDIIGDTKALFELSLVENSISSNPILNQLRSKSMDDVYALLNQVENGQQADLKASHSKQDVQDYVSLLEKVVVIRNTLLKVNETYIKSAAMEDAYRTEPAFKLQGSYRDMNKLVEKLVPIMNDKELVTLLQTHYESEAQTLTSSAEANLLKYKEITNRISAEEQERWDKIKETFVKNNKLKGLGSTNEMAQIISQLMEFSDGLKGIEEVLKGKK